MNQRYLVLCVFTAFIGYIHSVDFRCSDGPPGGDCTDDLSGYHVCSVTRGPSSIVTCPSNTRCSCFLNNKCTEADICKPYTKPNFVKDFVTYFDGTVAITDPSGTHTRLVKGLISQNEDKHLFMKRIWDGENQHFEYVRPTSPRNGKFQKIVVFADNTCVRTELDNFPLFGDQLEKFTLTSTTGDSTIWKTWKFQNGRRHLGQRLTVTKWVTENLPNGESKPVSYIEDIKGSQSERINTKTVWNFGLFFNEKIHEAFFTPHVTC